MSDESTAQDGRVTIKHLARFWITQRPDLRGAKTAAKVADSLGVPDISGSDVQQVTLGQPDPVGGYMLASRDGWQVTATEESLDIAKHTQGLEGAGPFDDFVEHVEKVLRSLPTQSQASRLATVTDVFLPTLSDAVMGGVVQALFEIPSALDQSPWEWDWRHVSTVKRQFKNWDEATNNIVSLRRRHGVIGTGHRFDRIFGSFEVNTEAQQTDARFDVEDMVAFLRESSGWLTDLEEAIRLHAWKEGGAEQ